jgi:hypothetical protein
MNSRRLLAATAATGLLGGALLAAPASAHETSTTAPGKGTATAPGLAKSGQVPPGQADRDVNRGQAKTVSLTAQLSSLNGSGASGTATATVRNQLIRDIEVHASGLSPDAPHAMHIHYGDDARNECPTMGEASNVRVDNGMRRLSTADGLPAYGPIVVSLTTTGDTSPSSALAVGRFPVSMDGKLHYSRSNIEFTDVAGTGYPGAGGTGTAKQIADAIRDGEGVVVIHGVDYNSNGRYDLASAGASELDPSLPAEATDPAACGVLR